jgi:membrane protein DedA with SNARE-associated domain
MNKIKLNYWIDVGLAMSFLICFITGLIKWPGLVKLIGLSTYKILQIKNISMLHDWSGLIMSVLVLVHLALHWKWIVSVSKNMFSNK